MSRNRARAGWSAASSTTATTCPVTVPPLARPTRRSATIAVSGQYGIVVDLNPVTTLIVVCSQVLRRYRSADRPVDELRENGVERTFPLTTRRWGKC